MLLLQVIIGLPIAIIVMMAVTSGKSESKDKG